MCLQVNNTNASLHNLSLLYPMLGANLQCSFYIVVITQQIVHSYYTVNPENINNCLTSKSKSNMLSFNMSSPTQAPAPSFPHERKWKTSPCPTSWYLFFYNDHNMSYFMTKPCSTWFLVQEYLIQREFHLPHTNQLELYKIIKIRNSLWRFFYQ